MLNMIYPEEGKLQEDYSNKFLYDGSILEAELNIRCLVIMNG